MAKEKELRQRSHAPEIEEYPPLKKDLVDKLVNMDEKAQVQFKTHYPFVVNYADKYRFARALIEDGRFENPIFLFENFINTEPSFDESSQKGRDSRREYEAVQKPLAVPLKNHLHFLLIQKGVLSHDSMEKETATRMIEAEVTRRQNIKDLIEEGWPIEVIGQLTTVELFSEVADARKFEELRAWTTRALLREYVGIIAGRKTKSESSISSLFDRIPEKVFEDTQGVKIHLITRYLENRFMRTITDSGLHEGLLTIDTLFQNTLPSKKRDFIEMLHERFVAIATQPIPEKFNSTLELKGRQRSFPSFEQRAFAYDFIHHQTRLLAAETGLGKTGGAYLAMENTDAEKVLVIAPAAGKATWSIEDEKLFKKPGNVYVINGASDIQRAIHEGTNGKKYIVISQELLGGAEKNSALPNQLVQLIDTVGIDGAIIDEIDNLNDPKAISTLTTKRLLEHIRTTYATRARKNLLTAPVIGLTATPIRSRLSNLNVIMHFLYSDTYAFSHAHATKERKTFSDSHLNRPDLAYFSLIGEKRMFRWEQASDVQAFYFDTIPVATSRFENCLYDFIIDDVDITSDEKRAQMLNFLNKVRLLEDCLLNPLLIKNEIRHTASNIPHLTIEEEIVPQLQHLAHEWKQTQESEKLNADKLIELGFDEIVMSCFFDDLLERGIDTLVAQWPGLEELRTIWEEAPISSKYKKLKQELQEGLQWKTDASGALTREKVFIVSPARKQGRTRDVKQREIIHQNGEKRDLYMPYELAALNDSTLVTHVKNWVSEAGYCSPEQVLVLDGDVSVGKERDRIIEQWVNDPNAAVLFVTLEAAYQSRDFTLNVTQDTQGRQISAVRKIFLSPTWHYQQLKQMAGRSQRHGQRVPVKIRILTCTDKIDSGKNEAVIFTYLLSRMALSGIVLTREEQDFFDSKRVGGRIPLQSRESIFLRDAFYLLRGRGEDGIESYIDSPSNLREGMTNAQLIAEKFFDHGRDEYNVTGHNAEFVSFLIKSLATQDSSILSLGAGTLLLQRKLKKGIDNMDINAHMMEAGWALASPYGGRKIVSRASRLGEDSFPGEHYHVVDCAFMLDWSNLDERKTILSNINRVLKPEGVAIITLPEGCFTSESFKVWIAALEKHFGFKVEDVYTGRSYGRSKLRLVKRLGWSIVARKVSGVDIDGLVDADLRFANENEYWVSETPKEKNSKSRRPKRDKEEKWHIKFDYFEIQRENNEKTTVTYEEEKETVGLDFLKGSKGSRSEYQAYRKNLLRPVQNVDDYGWEQAEVLIEEAFMRLQEENRIDVGKTRDMGRIYSLIFKKIKQDLKK